MTLAKKLFQKTRPMDEGSGKWVIDIEQRFNSTIYRTRESSPKVSIFKVPRLIRDEKPEAYDPYVVPLGPFFHSQCMKDLDDHKLNAVEATLRRLKVEKIETLIDSVKGCMDEIRDLYQDRAVEWNEETLAWMLTMDACFIIEYIYYPSPEKNFSLNFEMNDGKDVIQDFLKLENQVPLLVLKRILELDRSGNAMKVFASKVTKSIFSCHPFSSKSLDIERIAVEAKQYIRGGYATHLLDLYRKLIANILLGSTSKSDSSSASAQQEDGAFSFCTQLPSAARLLRAGICLDRSVDEEIRFINHGLGSATLFLPQITVDDRTETLLRNVMALEQCRVFAHEEGTRIISYYVMLLNTLIDSKEDVALLRKGNIIKSFMGSDEEVVEIFNYIDKGIMEEFYGPYDEVMRKVKAHYNNMLHKWIAGFKERHCSKAWLVASLVAAFLLLALTTIQAVYSVKS